MRGIAVGLLTVFLLVLAAIPVRAGLVISVGSTSIVQGGTGSIDVYLSSTATPATPDQLDDYAFTLQIMPIDAGNLAFSTPQGFAYLSSPQYVFYGDSADYIAGIASPPPLGGAVTQTVYNNDTFLGFDNTNSLNPVSLSTSSGPLLLASLSLDASITSAGESFTVALVPTSGNGSMASGASSYFNVVDSNFNEISAVPFGSTSGTVNIIAASVPEPASMVCALIGAAVIAACRRRRRFF